MFEALEQARQRDAKRIKPEDTKAVVRSVNDIKRVLAEFDPKANPDRGELTISTTLMGEDKDGKKILYKVSAPTRSKSKRTLLLEGFQLIKNRLDTRELAKEEVEPILVNGRAMAPPIPPTDGRMHIDPLIGHWLDARRIGLLVVWEFGDGWQYRYDIFEHRLTRVKLDENGHAIAG
jgi:hypothetical protein